MNKSARTMMASLALVVAFTALQPATAAAGQPGDPDAEPSQSAPQSETLPSESVDPPTVEEDEQPPYPPTASADPVDSVDPAEQGTEAASPTRPRGAAQAPQAALASCAPLPLTAPGRAPTATAERGDPETAECWTLHTGAAGAHVIRLLADSQGWSPYVTIYSGVTEVWSSYAYQHRLDSAVLAADRDYRIEVSGWPDEARRGYRLGVVPVQAPDSCPGVEDLSWTASPTSLTIPSGAVSCGRSTGPPPGRRCV